MKFADIFAIKNVILKNFPKQRSKKKGGKHYLSGYEKGFLKAFFFITNKSVCGVCGVCGCECVCGGCE